MAWLDDREFWVNLIGFASIASAAIFGLLALFTDYKKDGKITRWGRLYAGGIALSAVFAMTSAVLQKRIAADETAEGEKAARDQRALQQTQFNTQLRHLQNLNGQMRRVNAASADLLADQRLLLASAQQGMLLTAHLGVQERENTGRVLRGLWDETNRISANSFVLNVSFTCSGGLSGNPPALFPSGSGTRAEVILWRPEDEEGSEGMPEAERVQRVTFGRLGRNFLFMLPPSRGVHLISIVHQTTVLQERGEQSVSNIQNVRFSSFGGDLGAYVNPEAWRELFIEVRLGVQQPGIAEQFRTSVAEPLPNRRAMEEMGTVFRDVAEDARLTRLPCGIAWATVEVNDRVVVELDGHFLLFQNDAEDNRGLLLGVFPFTAVRPDVLPRYSAGPRSPASAALARPRH